MSRWGLQVRRCEVSGAFQINSLEFSEEITWTFRIKISGLSEKYLANFHRNTLKYLGIFRENILKLFEELSWNPTKSYLEFSRKALQVYSLLRQRQLCEGGVLYFTGSARIGTVQERHEKSFVSATTNIHTLTCIAYRPSDTPLSIAPAMIYVYPQAIVSIYIYIYVCV